MDAKHTPAPWMVSLPYTKDVRIRIIGPENRTVAFVRAEADADLIAAAPELASALRAFLDAMRSVDPLDSTDLPRRMGMLVSDARGALQKAGQRDA